jgi:hypothetical protein
MIDRNSLFNGASIGKSLLYVNQKMITRCGLAACPARELGQAQDINPVNRKDLSQTWPRPDLKGFESHSFCLRNITVPITYLR